MLYLKTANSGRETQAYHGAKQWTNHAKTYRCQRLHSPHAALCRMVLTLEAQC